MTAPDFRALCTELVQAMTDDSAGCWHREHDVLAKARTALAEPVPFADKNHFGHVHKMVQPTDEELNDTYWTAWHEHLDRTNSVLHAAGLRAVLARWGTSNLAQVRSSLSLESEGLSDKEILEWANYSDSPVPPEYLDPDMGGWQRCFSSEEFCATVRAALKEWGTHNLAQARSSLGDAPQPVPVSERLPGKEGEA